jgi:hypothetical protein
MADPPSPDTAILERFARVLQELGLPCKCQHEVERTLAVFAELESRRAHRRLLAAARQRALLLRHYLDYLDGLDGNDASRDPDDLAAHAETFRVMAVAAGEGAASLEALVTLHSRPST